MRGIRGFLTMGKDFRDYLNRPEFLGKGMFSRLIDYSRRSWRRAGVIVFIGIPISISLIFWSWAYIRWLGLKAPTQELLDTYNRELQGNLTERERTPIIIFDRNGVNIGEIRRTQVPEIRPSNMQDYSPIVWALLASEDREFYEHNGIRIKAMLRALYSTVFKGETQGGSTLTQQLAKLILSKAESVDDIGKEIKIRERSFINKGMEFFCAFYLESKFNKDEILAMYLNQVFLGYSSIGFDDAARRYFGVSAKDVSIAEAAMLVGIIPAPSIYNPMVSLKKSLERQSLVMTQMARNGELAIKKNQFDPRVEEKRFALRHKVIIRTIQGGQIFRSNIGHYPYTRNIERNEAPDFNNEIEAFIRNHFKETEIKQKVKSIFTTLDINKQRLAENLLYKKVKLIRERIESLGKRNSSNKKEDHLLELISSGTNGAFVSINPVNGYIDSMVGSYQYTASLPINRTLNIYRQPGSSIKGLVYAIAMAEKVVHPLSTVIDEKIDYGGYSPRNWYKGYKGPLFARNAFSLSVNTIPVKLLKEIGTEKFVDTLQRLLVWTDKERKTRIGNRANLSMALGSIELSPMELARIYGALLSGGHPVVPKFITRIKNFEDETIFETSSENTTESVIDPTAAAMTINLMQGVIAQGGTMVVGNERLRKIAGGKTGTVQSPRSAYKKWHRHGVRDTWFVGLLPNEVTVVWIGNDQGAPIPGSGSLNSGRLWEQFAMNLLEKNEINTESLLPPTENGVPVSICAQTGLELKPDLECESPLIDQIFYPEQADEIISHTEQVLAQIQEINKQTVAEELENGKIDDAVNKDNQESDELLKGLAQKTENAKENDLSNAGNVILDEPELRDAHSILEWQIEKN